MSWLDKLNWTTILSILVAVELQIGSGQMSLAHMFPDAWIPTITAWSSNLGTIGATIMAVLSYGNKRVPSDAIAVKAISGSVGLADLQTGDHVNINTGSGAVGAGKVIGALLLAIMLNGLVFTHAYAQIPKPAVASPLDAVKNFAVADIQAALDDANANNDTAGAQCWAALLPVVQAQQGITLKKFGVFLALQKARDAVRTVDAVRLGSGPIGDLKNKCAAIIVDTNTFLIRLGIVGAGSILPF